MRRRLVPVALCAVMLAVACGGKSNSPSANRPRSTATVSIVSPTPNAVVSGKFFTITVKVNGGKITSVTRNTNLSPTLGHVHVSVDGTVVSMNFKPTQKIAVPKKKGSHILQAEFVAIDHFPFSPRVLAAAPFRVK